MASATTNTIMPVSEQSAPSQATVTTTGPRDEQPAPQDPSEEGGVGGGSVLIRIHVPELNVNKCLQFARDELVWNVKQQCLAAMSKVAKIKYARLAFFLTFHFSKHTSKRIL